MSDSKGPEVTHVYDGIEEYDNPLPGWWTLLFQLSVVFAFCYLFINLARPEWVDTRLEYKAAVEAENERQFKAIGNLEPDAATILTFLNDPEKQRFLSVGEAIFKTNCISCHGRNGEGGSGPNLTDDSYLLVKQLTDIPHTVINGSIKAGMPAWGNRLSTNEVVLVSAYAASLRGQNVPGKEAQGDPIPAWSVAN
jgi:cytochrome c oxidase cbb3-type subunit 3